MQREKFFAFYCAILFATAIESRAQADSVVIANRSDQEVQFRITMGQQDRLCRLEPGDLLPVAVSQPALLSFGSQPARQYLLQPNSVHFFAKSSDGLQLHEIGMVPTKSERKTPSGFSALPLEAPLHEVTVKLLVDDKEPGTRALWEKRLKERLLAASDIMEKQCRVRFKVVAMDVWTSQDTPSTLEEALGDFERKVRPLPAQMVIGFTSNRHIEATGTHLGGTRGPLHSHLLIREWIPRTEPERLEVLLHELGHFLGAAHSPEPDSIMRPRLGDGLQRARQTRFIFDPLNCLAMNLVVEELWTHRVRSIRELDPNVRARLCAIYSTLSKAQPEDPVAARLITLLEGNTSASSPSKQHPLAMATRTVLAVLDTAAQNRTSALKGDALTEHYVRVAAEAAQHVPADQQRAAFLLALAIGLDDSALLRDHPVTAELLRQIETSQERQKRLNVLGSPTMRDRRDWTQHFFISAALTTLAGPSLAEAVGLFKELEDAKPGGSGFSFGDLGADYAGISFAQRLQKGKNSLLPTLQKDFRVIDYLPPLSDLREGLSQKDFATQFGSLTDPRFRAEKETILQRVRNLPPYRGEVNHP